MQLFMFVSLENIIMWLRQACMTFWRQSVTQRAIYCSTRHTHSPSSKSSMCFKSKGCPSSFLNAANLAFCFLFPSASVVVEEQHPMTQTLSKIWQMEEWCDVMEQRGDQIRLCVCLAQKYRLIKNRSEVLENSACLVKLLSVSSNLNS